MQNLKEYIQNSVYEVIVWKTRCRPKADYGGPNGDAFHTRALADRKKR